MAKKIEDVLGDSNKTKDPALATPSGEDDQDENPLEKMDKISKEKEKKETGSKELDADVVEEMLKTGENTQGMFEPENPDEVDGLKLHEDQDEKAKFKMGNKVKPQGKYEKQFKNDLLKNPDQYKVMTPRGEMTVAEAIRAGYDPMTKTFNKERSQDAIKQKHLSGLNDADKKALEQFTSPANAQVAPADAEMYGLQPNSPMIKQQATGQQPVPPQGAAPSPVGNALPGSEESTAPNGIDIASMLGGAQ
jgi:hypothetical protein